MATDSGNYDVVSRIYSSGQDEDTDNSTVLAGNNVANWSLTDPEHSFQYPSSVPGGCLEWIQPDPNYGHPNEVRERLSSNHVVPVTVDMQWGNSSDIVEDTPSIQYSAPNSECFPLFQYWSGDGNEWTSPLPGRQYWPEQQKLYPPQKIPLLQVTRSCPNVAIQDGIHPYVPVSYERQLRNSLQHHDVSTRTTNPPPKPTTTTGKRCFECSFSHKACISSNPKSPCDRCTKLYLKLFATPQLSEGMSDTSIPLIDKVIAFDTKSTQVLLTRLRGASEAVSNLLPGVKLEDYFKGSVVCHMDHEAFATFGFSTSAVPVTIKHLATTRKALEDAESHNQDFPLPGLDDIQMDRFIDVASRMCNLKELHRDEQAIIVTALRCSEYLGILFNWDRNAICFEGIESAPQAKNLVLETAYAIAYRVQQLLKVLCQEVNRSLIGNGHQDPATISCALRIVYRSIDCFRKSEWKAKLKWNSGNLQDLKTFLTGLQERAPAALKALERYRVTIGYHRCAAQSDNVKAFQALIDAKKSTCRAVTFNYQQHHSNDIDMIWRATKSYYEKSYTEVLEASVDWDSSDEPKNVCDESIETKLGTLENPYTAGACSELSLAPFLDGYKTFDAESAILVSCESGSDNGIDDLGELEIAIPSLTTGQTISAENDLVLEAIIQRQEEKLVHLRNLRLGYPLPDGTHDDWVEYMPREGPPVEFENKFRFARLSKIRGKDSAGPYPGKRRRQQDNTLQPPKSHASFDPTGAPPLVAKRLRSDAPSMLTDEGKPFDGIFDDNLYGIEG